MADNKQLTTDEDAILMAQFQKGSKDAFNSLFSKYQQMVFGVISRYINDRAYAEDMTQEVFMRVYKARERYSPTTQFRYYLFTIVHNLCVNEIRDSSRRKTKPTDFSDDFPLTGARLAKGGGFQDGSEPIVDAFQQKEIRMAVKAAIDSLPAQQRMAVILDKYEGMSYEEIARTMKQSVQAVKSILWRARQNLKERLKKYIKEE
ncbi:MAG: sigma-70 family RNA polymerase sigma factor [Planctomycetota bacterium]